MAGPVRRPGFPARIDLGPAARPARVPRLAAGRAAAPEPAAATGAAAIPADLAQDTIPARARMLQLLAAQGIRDERVLRAMATVDRRQFVDSALATQAFEDTALPIGLGQTISKPGVVARMLELLLQGATPEADGRIGRVLDIGTGCGYQALVLAQLAREVYSIERLRPLHERARANLRPMRVANVRLILGDGMQGYADGAPYAAIIAAAGGDAIPPAWIAQLANGGRIVAPLARGGEQALVVVDKSRAVVAQQTLEAVNFVPLKSGVA